ncbi:MAG: hypothetical protein M0C28_13320 [Candidatus Moduliflexus flocculans]|nr:hypothetical protein [Candidatus Moduliflexus flocculans]
MSSWMSGLGALDLVEDVAQLARRVLRADVANPLLELGLDLTLAARRASA